MIDLGKNAFQIHGNRPMILPQDRQRHNQEPSNTRLKKCLDPLPEQCYRECALHIIPMMDHLGLNIISIIHLGLDHWERVRCYAQGILFIKVSPHFFSSRI